MQSDNWQMLKLLWNRYAAQNLLDIFIKLTSTYLDDNALTFNMHLLRHLSSQVERFGNIFSLNTAVFESWIGWYKQLKTGSLHSIYLIARRYIDFKMTMQNSETVSLLCTVLGRTANLEKSGILPFYYSIGDFHNCH